MCIFTDLKLWGLYTFRRTIWFHKLSTQMRPTVSHWGMLCFLYRFVQGKIYNKQITCNLVHLQSHSPNNKNKHHTLQRPTILHQIRQSYIIHSNKWATLFDEQRQYGMRNLPLLHKLPSVDIEPWTLGSKVSCPTNWSMWSDIPFFIYAISTFRNYYTSCYC